MLLIIVCTSCKAPKTYLVSEYLNELAYQSGICLSQENKEVFNELLTWGIVEEEDYKKVNDELTYDFLIKTISNLLDEDVIYVKEKKLIKDRNDNKSVSQEEALIVIKEAVHIINNPVLNNEFEIKEKESKHLDDYSILENYLETKEELKIGDIIFLEEDKAYKKVIDIQNGKYVLIDPSIDEVLNELSIEGSNEIDFDEVEIIPYNEEKIETSYVNKYYDLLASNRHTFSKNGFNVAYSFNSSGLDVRVSKKTKDKLNMFFDISLSNIKPSYKWKYKDGDVEQSFFKVDFKLTNELGLSTGKYDRYYLDFKDMDSSSFSNAIKSVIKTSDDEVECTIPICQIKTPIPNIPLASFNIDVVAKVYVTGRVEIVLYNDGVIGFESRNGKFRVIHDVERDADFIVGGSARAVAGINFNLETSNLRLMDVEFDGGIRAAVKTTLHLYDEQGNDTKEEIEIPYSVVQEVSKENNDVRVCGDVSLNWVFDIQINTSKSFLYKYGLTYNKSLLTSKNQVFNNLTHIENWQFVKKCTRKNRDIITTTNTTSALSSDKIVLRKYSAVVIKGETYEIPIISLPNGYTNADLVFYSNETSIASVNNGIVNANNIGSTKIEIKTKDDKYKAYINILVSTG